MNYVPAPKTTTPRMDMSPLPMQVIYYFFVILKTSVKYVSYIYLILSYFHFVLGANAKNIRRDKEGAGQ